MISRPWTNLPVLVLALAAFVTPTLSLFAGSAATPCFIIGAVLLWRRYGLASPPVWMVAAAVAWALASCLWTVASSFQALRPVLGLGALAVLALGALGTVGQLDERDRRRIGGAVVLGIGLSALVLLFEVNSRYALARLLIAGPEPMLQSTLQALESRGAVVLQMLVWPTLGVCLRWGARAVVPLLALVTAALFGEGKYASVLAFAAGGMAFLLVVAAPQPGLRLLRLGSAALVLAMPLVGQVLPSVQDLEQGTLFNSARHRVVIWRFALDRWSEHPVRGWGMDASRAVPGGEDATQVVIDGKINQYQHLPLHPHNGPLQVWLELGVPGAALLAAMLWGVIGRLARSPLPRTQIALRAAAVTSALLIGTVSFGIWQSWWQSTLWLTALLFAATAPLGAERKEAA